MKNFDIQSIIDSVHSAVGTAESELHDALAEAGLAHGDNVGGDKNVVREFAVGASPQLILRNIHAGDVIIEGDDTAVIQVRAIAHGKFKHADELPFKASHDGNRVHIEPHGRFHNAPIDYYITVPRDCGVEVTGGVNLDVRVNGTDGHVTLETVSGDIVVEDISGTCNITTESGDVAVNRIGGALEISTTSGDATVSASHLERFVLQSVSGDFIVESSLQADHHYLASTTSGDVRLIMPADTGVTATFRSFSGDIAYDLPVDVIRSNRRNWQGRINGGGALVEVTSTSGDLLIEGGAVVPQGRVPASEPTHSTAAARSPLPPADRTAESVEPIARAVRGHDVTPVDKETALVLAALERGDISVEEAMEKLESQ